MVAVKLLDQKVVVAHDIISVIEYAFNFFFECAFNGGVFVVGGAFGFCCKLKEHLYACSRK